MRLNVSSTLHQSLLCLGLIKQFVRDVDWGDLDYLLVDTPPGTSDEHLSIVQYLKTVGITGAVVITTPQVCCHGDLQTKNGMLRPCHGQWYCALS